jgi:hypothetical protein
MMMTPVQLNETVKQLLLWDIDRTAALITGIIIGAVAAWWLMRQPSGSKPLLGPNGNTTAEMPTPNPSRIV